MNFNTFFIPFFQINYFKNLKILYIKFEINKLKSKYYINKKREKKSDIIY